MKEVGEVGREGVTRGDVQAVFEAFITGGWSVLLHGGVAKGAPADDVGTHGAIRPFSPWDGRHFCAEDWHVILMATIEGGDKTFTHQDAERLLTPTTIVFTLDGTPLFTTRTAIKRFLNPARFNWEEAYAFQEGKIMSPQELGVGEHTLRVVAKEPGQPTFDNTIHFTIDAAGTGTCAG